MSPLTIILNTSSGSAGRARLALEQAIARTALDASVVVVDGGGIRGAAERAAAAGRAVVAAGGDGTVSTIAGIAVDARVPFGVVPLGTLNHFARDVGIPTEIDPAIDVLASGRVVPLDVGVVNGRTFVNNASLGFYVRLVKARQEEQRRGHRKWVGFAMGLARAWINYEAITVRLTVDGADMIRRTPFVFVGNGDYEAEGLDTGRRCSLEALRKGQLSIYAAPECGRFELLGLSLRALARRLTPDVKLESFRADRVVIETAPRHAAAALDGEVLSIGPPFDCRVRRGALHTIVPRPLP